VTSRGRPSDVKRTCEKILSANLPVFLKEIKRKSAFHNVLIDSRSLKGQNLERSLPIRPKVYPCSNTRRCWKNKRQQGVDSCLL